MDWRTELISLAEAYSQATGRSEARVATIVANQGAFFKSLRAGGGCTVDTALKVKRWFHENWPAGLAWPVGVTLPGIISDATPSEGAVA